MKVTMLKLSLMAVGARGLNCQVEECGRIVHDQVLLQQASGFSKSIGSVSEVAGASCSSVVGGAIARKSIWGRTKECMCPDGEVLHGADPVCWGVAGADPYFLPDTMVGRDCWCKAIYAVDKRGKTACAPGFSKITDERACKKAAESLDQTWVKVSHDDDDPAGCFTDGSLVKFNTHPTGKRDWKYATICSDNTPDLEAYAAFPWSMKAKEVCQDEDAKVVYWVRHAEGGHQRGKLDEPNKVACLWERDPDLTDVGMKQAENLKNSPAIAAALFNVSERAQLVVSSPLQRTMLTSILGFTDLLKHELPAGERAEWLLDADCQEFPGSLGSAELNCNKGDPSAGAAALKKYHREDLLEQYQSLDPTWTDRNSGRYKNSEESKRFQDFTASLADREETRIIVVSHGKFMQHGLGSDSPKDNAIVKPYALCGNTWHYLGA